MLTVHTHTIRNYIYIIYMLYHLYNVILELIQVMRYVNTIHNCTSYYINNINIIDTVLNSTY